MDGFGGPQMHSIQKGLCSKDSVFFNYDEIQDISRCAMEAFDRHINVTFFSTAHN